MKKLHDYMMTNSPMYASWENQPGHTGVHWTFFIMTAILVTSSISASITNLAYSYDLPVQSQADLHRVVVTHELPPAQDHILVKFKDNVGQTKRDEVLARNGFSQVSEIKAIGVKRIHIPDSVTPEEAVQNMLADSNVAMAEVDGMVSIADVVPNDPNYSSQWYLPQINAPAGWAISTGTPGVVIAVIDSGLDPADPEFSGKLVPGWNYTTGTNVIASNMIHGTLTAGDAAATTNNNNYIAGIAWNNNIMPLVVVDSTGSASFSSLADATIFAADHGAKVINISLGGPTDSSTMQSAVNYAWNKGLVIVAAAGNNGSSALFYPAAENNVVAASATCDSADSMASFSSYGSDIDVAAPGCNINGYNGTSFSSPITAGVVALIFSRNPKLTNSQVVSLLTSNARDVGAAGWDQYYGYGVVDAGKALAAVGQPIVDTQAPSIPGNFTAQAVSSNQVTLSWSNSTDNVGVVGYNVFKNGTKITTITTNSYNDNSVVPSSTYAYSVSAYDAAGNISTATPVVSVNTPGQTVSFGTFQVTTKTVNSATVIWSTNIPSTGVVYYGTNKSSLGSNAADTNLGTSHSVVIPNLSKFTTYYYKITATSGDGTSSVSTSVSSFKTARK